MSSHDVLLSAADWSIYCTVLYFTLLSFSSHTLAHTPVFIYDYVTLCSVIHTAEDEGEHESRDLEPGAPPPPPVQQPVVRPPPQQQRFRAAPPNHAAAAVAANPPRPPPPRATPLQVPLPPPRATPVASTSIPNRQQNQQSSSARNPYAAATSNATATTSAASNPYQSNATSAPSNPYQNSNNSNNNSVNGSQNSAGPSNPYQNNNSNNNSMNGSQNSRDSASGTARMRPPPRPQQPQPPPPATNRLYDDDLYDDDAIPIQDDMEDLMMVDSNTNSNHPASRNTNSSSMPIAAHGSSSRPRHDRVSTMPVPPPPAAAAVSRVSGAAGGTLLQAISFVELRNRLVRARENEELYRQMFGQSFVVQARQKGVKLEFNIEKIKGSSKEAKKAKKVRRCDGTVCYIQFNSILIDLHMFLCARLWRSTDITCRLGFKTALSTGSWFHARYRMKFWSLSLVFRRYVNGVFCQIALTTECCLILVCPPFYRAKCESSIEKIEREVKN